MTLETSNRAQPLISIIVPSYNYGHFVNQALESLQAQTYQKWECVVVDDGSTDDTGQVVAYYSESDSRIKYMYQSNQGLAAARNIGLRNTTGKYIQFLDADDMLESEKFEHQVGYLEQHPTIDIVYGSVRYFTTENITERLYTMWGENAPWMPEVSSRSANVLTALTHGNIMVVNAPLVRRTAANAVGLFDGTVKGIEDWDYWIRCAAQGKQFQYLNIEGTHALVRSHSSSMSKNERLMRSNGALVRKKIEQNIDDADVRRLNRRLIARDLGEQGIDEVLRGSMMRGSLKLLKAGVASKSWSAGGKWIACAFLAPFVPKQSFREMVLNLQEDSIRRILLYKSRQLISNRRP